VDGGAATYKYDALGRRTSKTVGSLGTDYLYDLAGQVVTEYNNGCAGGQWCWSAGYIHLNGQLLAEYKDATTYFVLADHLGSTRLLTRVDQTVRDSMDYQPYGEQIAGDTATTHKFTGKERDGESGLDYFGARYYGSSLGRFASPDPMAASAHPAVPLSWNRYAYGLDNPLRFLDVEGKCSAPAVGNGQVGVCIASYIGARSIGVVGFGDNRGPNSHGGTFRTEDQLVVDLAHHSVQKGVPTQAGGSQVGVPQAGIVAYSRQGTAITNISAVTTDKHGNMHFTVTTTGINGFYGWPGAPTGTIHFSFQFQVSPSGEVTIVGGSRVVFPSIEVYSYDASGNAALVKNYPETSADDLDKGTTAPVGNSPDIGGPGLNLFDSGHDSTAGAADTADVTFTNTGHTLPRR